MCRKKNHQRSLNKGRAVLAARERESAEEQWRNSEQTAPQLDAAARALIEQAGSRERAKEAVDAFDEGHPP